MTKKEDKVEILHRTQNDFVKKIKGKRFFVLKAGRRWGKTYLMAHIALARAMLPAARKKKDGILLKERFPDIRIAYTTTNLTDARDIFSKDILGVFENLKDVKFTNKPWQISWTNAYGARVEIFLKGWQNADKSIRGREYDLVFLDEVDSLKDFKKDFTSIVLPTLTTRTGSRVLFAGTPKANNPNLMQLKLDNENDDLWAFAEYTSYDNPYQDAEQLDRIKATTPKEFFETEYMVQYTNTSKILFDRFSVEDLFVVPQNNELEGQRWMAVDVGGSTDKTVITILINGLVQSFNSNPIDVENDIIKYSEKFDIQKTHIIGDDNGSGEYLFNRKRFNNTVVKFRGTHLPIPDQINISTNSNNKKKNLVSYDFKNLRAQTYFYLAEMVNNGVIALTGYNKEERGFIVDALSVTNIVEGSSEGNNNRTSKILVTPKDQIKAVLKGKSPDHADTLAMLAYFYIRLKNGTLRGNSVAVDWDKYPKARSYRKK